MKVQVKNQEISNPNIDLRKKKFSIFGVQKSGKTILMKYLCKGFKKPLIYDIHKDFYDVPNAVVYTPKTLTMNELAGMSHKAKMLGMNGRIDAFIIDDADTYFNSSYHLYPNVLDLNSNHRHYGIAFGLIARRPQDIPTKIVESCHALFIFKLEGVNAIQRFREIHPDLPAMIEELSFEKHDFIYKEIGKKPIHCNPLNIKVKK